MDKIKELAEKYWIQAVALRRYFHQYPELSAKEFKTADKIAETLDLLNISYIRNVGGTGLVALVQGELAGSKCVALRADMDALPLYEIKETPYQSRHKGIMHACGHDAHIASLLGTLMIISNLKPYFGGTVKAIFQPSEEECLGGADALIEACVLQQPDVQLIFGQHVTPEIPTGSIGIRAGACMASSDEIHLTITGRGGHAALSKEVINPLMAGVCILSEIDNNIRRMQPADPPSVVAFGKFLAPGKSNIICDTVEIEGTIRTFDETWRKQVHHIIKKVAEQVAKKMNVQVFPEIRHGYPVLNNDEKATEHVRRCAIQYLGNDKVIELQPRMTADDFALYLQEVPGCYYRLGVTAEGSSVHQLHTVDFDIDEEALKVGMGLMSWVAISALNESLSAL
ncbi:MAG: amidohydrolase [Bacteroidales bacterium]|jgi:amidohydrolase|nr:amidohydrolase [Bacteroidales bacterium]